MVPFYPCSRISDVFKKLVDSDSAEVVVELVGSNLRLMLPGPSVVLNGRVIETSTLQLTCPCRRSVTAALSYHVALRLSPLRRRKMGTGLLFEVAMSTSHRKLTIYSGEM